MWYGKVIFIKKLGGDGSKFPVSIRGVKIGRSDDCPIRIQNPLVSSEHCEILIDEYGQAKIKNLSKTNPTILNCETLGSGEFLLKHKDIFKVGERLARWEYLPSSKYFNESDNNLNYPVSDVVSQKRMLKGPSARNSNSFGCSLKGSLNRRVTAGGIGLDNKLSRFRINPASSAEKNLKRRSLQVQKVPFSPQVDGKGNMRVQSLNDYEEDSERKASLRRSQAWEIHTVSPSHTINTKIKSSKKSTPIKSPQVDALDVQLPNDNFTKTCTTVPLTSDLEGIKDFIPRTKEISSRKSLIYEPSDRLSKYFSIESTKSSSKLIKTPSSEKLKTCKKFSKKSNRKENLSKKDNTQLSASLFDLTSNSSFDCHRDSSKFTPSRKSKSRKSLLKKSLSRFSSADLLNPTSVMDVKRLSRSDSPLAEDEVTDNMIKFTRSKSLSSLDSSKQRYSKFSNQDLSHNSLSTTLNTNLRPRTSFCSASKFVNKLPLENKSLPNFKCYSPKENSNLKKVSQIEDASTEKNDAQSRTKKTSHNRASKRKFASFVTSAERAAKKLETISLPKPDKNKKAALLVLGKAGCKMKNLQNANTIIKNKIVKKAIKQKRNGLKNTGALESVQSFATPEMQITKNKETQYCSKKTQSLDAKQLPIKKNKSKLLVKVKTSKKNLNKSALKSLNERSLSKQVTPKKRGEKKSIMKDINYEVNSEIGIKHNSIQLDDFLSSTEDRAYRSDEILLLQDNKKSENVDADRKLNMLNNINSPTQYDSSDIFNRRTNSTSKRLSSKSLSDFSNFIEASPNGLGLSQKSTMNVFKTPKQINHNSSLVTPKNKGSSGIIKSLSTSKINRKNVRFSRKNLNESSFSDLNLTHGTTFDFSTVQTPDISTDVFISPLSERNSLKEKLKTPNSLSKHFRNDKTQSEEFKNYPQEETINKSKRKSKSFKNSKTELFLAIEHWEEEENVESINSENQEMKILRKSKKKSPKNDLANMNGIQQLMELPESEDMKNNLTDVKGVRRLMASPKPQKSPKNDLTDVRGVRRLLASPRSRKSPKNDLTDVRGVRRLMASPKPQKSPKNDLTDVRGVRRLMAPPKPQKSPKNDLTDVRGVRRLMASPRSRKSPKNDLTDVRGVRRLMASPRSRKSPKNDLTDVRGVRRLMASPKPQKSPKNDLTDVKGVRRLMASPKPQKSPKNDLTDVRGVRRLMASPRSRKSPKNDLTDVRGVRRLMASPRSRKSPKNDLTDVRGVRRLMAPPKPQKSPKNDLTDVRGVRRLMTSPRSRKSPKNDSTDVCGIDHLFGTPKEQKSSENVLSNNISGEKSLVESSDNIQTVKILHKKGSNVNEVHHLFSLNKEDSFDFDTSSAGELFISPNKPRSTRKRLGGVDNIPYFMQVRVTRSSRGIVNEAKEINSPRKIAKRIPKTTKGSENSKILMEPSSLAEVQAENAISENQDKRITRSNKINKLQVSLTSVERKKLKNISDSDAKDKEVRAKVENMDSINEEDCKAGSATRTRKRAEEKVIAEESRRLLRKRSAATQSSPVACKMTRSAKRLIDEEQNKVDHGTVRTSRARKAVSDNVTSTSESKSTKSRRKYVAEESTELNTRSKSRSKTVENPHMKEKIKSSNGSSPLKTRQQRWKEESSSIEKKLRSKRSLVCVKTRGKGK